MNLNSKPVKITIASIVAVLLIIGGFIAFAPGTSKKKISSTPTAAAKKDSANSAEPATDNGTVTTPDSSYGSNSNTAVTTTTPISTASATTAGAASSQQTNQSTTPPQTPAAPETPVTPANPTFHITFHPDELAVQDTMAQLYGGEYGGTPNDEYVSVPFSISYDDGFVPQYSYGGNCILLEAPALESPILCNVADKTSEAILDFDGAPIPGHYKLQMTYSVNGAEQTIVTEFDLPATPTYHVTFHPEDAYTETSQVIPGYETPSYEYLVIPYEITYDEGFTPAFDTMPSCSNFLETPANTEIWCNVAQKFDAIVIQMSDDTAPGSYLLQTDFSISGISRSYLVGFNL